jgi:phosphotransferase system enzyme I (PtsP)
MEDPYFKDRAADVKDVAQRLLSKLAHSQVEFFDFSKPVILVADEVTASLLVEIPRTSLKGVISCKGSVNSHAAILARNMGVPAIMNIGESIDEFDDHYIVMDGTSGKIIIEPDNAIREEYKQLIETENNIREIAEKELYDSVVTLDNQKISVELNAGMNLDFETKGNFVDGVGLYRTEIPFMLQDNVLTEQEQINNYRNFLISFKDVPVCMRTLDIGGDKQLSYLKIHEANPALGWRGVRLMLDNRPLFMTQFKAMLKANIGLGNLKIMIPMISSSKEIEETRQMLDLAYNEVKEEMGLTDEQLRYPKFGAMIEVPSAVMLLEELSRTADFYSIGTNDLTQYILAVDRNNQKVAHCYDPYHPAVLRTLDYIFKECQRLDKPVSICGEMAGDYLGILILLAIGYRTFSMNLSSIARIKYLLRRIDVSKIKQIIDDAGLTNIEKIKTNLKNYISEQNLTRFYFE